MSAPDTNMETQKARHRGPLVGMAVLVFVVGIGLAYYLGTLAANGDDPTAADDPTNGTTVVAPADG